MIIIYSLDSPSLDSDAHKSDSFKPVKTVEEEKKPPTTLKTPKSHLRIKKERKRANPPKQRHSNMKKEPKHAQKESKTPPKEQPPKESKHISNEPHPNVTYSITPSIPHPISPQYSQYKNQNYLFPLPFDIPDTIKTHDFDNFSEFLDFYIYWEQQILRRKLPANRVCIVPTTHGMANKVFGMISMMIYAMLSGKIVESMNYFLE